MFRLAKKFSRVVRNGAVPFSLQKLPASAPALPKPAIRHYCAKTNGYPNPVVVETIKYATSLARDHKTEESYDQGLRVLDHCDFIHNDVESKALVELARSTLLFERGNFPPALEGLHKLQTNGCGVAMKVAACEALVGACLEHYQEEEASRIANLALHIIGQMRVQIRDGEAIQILEARLKAVKGLTELVRGNLDLAMSSFEEAKPKGMKTFVGNAWLSYAEFLHGMREFSSAKELYEKVIHYMFAIKDICDPINLAACNMIKEEVAIAACCSLGQLEAHMGNFSDAEVTLTGALKEMEQRFGPRHPKVGVILTCIALMYRQRAIAESSSSLLIQEGLFRRAIEVLHAPPLDFEGICGVIHRKDIIALARGGCAEVLSVQQLRKAEGEKLKKWSEKAWANPWISLGDALDCPGTSAKVPVIDTRICRAV